MTLAAPPRVAIHPPQDEKGEKQSARRTAGALQSEIAVDVVSTAAQFDTLRAEWNALAERHANPLLRHEWFAAAIDAEGEEDLRIFTARRHGVLSAVVPLRLERHGSAHRLIAIDHFLFEPQRLLHSDPAALSALLDAVWRERLPVFLPRLEFDGPERGLIDAGGLALLARKGVTIRVGRRGAGIIISGRDGSRHAPLADTWERFEQGMRASSRSKIRRKLKLAQRSGAVDFAAVTPTTANLSELLAEVFRVEAAGWKGRARTSIAADDRMRAFMSSYARRATELGTLRLFFLRIGAETAAVRLAVAHGRRLWELKIGYDEKFSQCSPGLLLTNDTLKYAHDAGLAALEFLGARETWHETWPTEDRELSKVLLVPLSVRSLWSLGYHLAAAAGRKTRRRLFSG